jgi:hypothetical protein
VPISIVFQSLKFGIQFLILFFISIIIAKADDISFNGATAFFPLLILMEF